MQKDQANASFPTEWLRLKSKELTLGEAEFIDDRLQDHLNNPDDIVSLDEVKTKLDAKYRR
jgi:hypothetical protein